MAIIVAYQTVKVYLAMNAVEWNSKRVVVAETINAGSKIAAKQRLCS